MSQCERNLFTKLQGCGLSKRKTYASGKGVFEIPATNPWRPSGFCWAVIAVGCCVYTVRV